MKADNSDALYIVAEAFREKLSQILGRELHIVAQFDGNLPLNITLHQYTVCRI